MLEMQDFKDFSISQWYSIFKHISLKTILIEIPEPLLNKFQAGETDIELNELCTPQFIEELKNAINSLNKNAFVKNNWHAPMDAKMFSFGNNLKVTNIDDIMLYFSTSNILQEDFNIVKGVPFYLNLRPWTSIHPAAEFRCIVINNVLRGITPRDWPTFYAHFNEEGPQIIDQLRQFYDENIKLKFPRKNYVFDIVLSFPDQPYILDFGPLNSKTNLYAFSWNEIVPLINKDSPEEVAPVFRYLESDIGIMTKSDALYKFGKSQS